MGIEVRTRKVSAGDCIWLRYGKDRKTNIIIDSGTTMKYKVFQEVIDKIIANNERVDLLILTHIDDDHINGFKKYISKINCECIDEVWFHGKGVEAYSITERTLNSPKSAINLINLLEEKKINVNSDIFMGEKIIINDGIFHILTPTQEAVKEVATVISEHQLHSGKNYTQDLDWLYANEPYIKDQSKTNRASISFILTYEGINMAFLGDAHAEDVVYSKEKYFKELKIDLVKLSHHGSSKNTTDEIIKSLKCKNFIISTNKKVDKRTIAKLVNNLEEVTIYCNYYWWDKSPYFTDEDMKKYLNEQKLMIIYLNNRGIECRNEGEKVWTLMQN